MRAHDPTARNKAAGLGRARMLMKAKLGWLAGYPDAQGWTGVPEDGERAAERLTLDRDHLRRATYTASKLRGEFPRAMPALVGDVDAWHRAVSHVLAALKPWVHHGHAPPAALFESELYSRTTRARATALRQQHPSLQGLVDALSWVLATRATVAAKALAWVEREAAALTVAHEQLDEPTALALSIELVHLSLAVGPKALRSLMQLVGEPAGYRAPTQGAVEQLRQADALFGSSDRRTLPPEPRVRLPGELPTLTRWLLAQDRPTAKRCLELLDRCALPSLLVAWDQWWPSTRDLLRRAHAIRSHQDESRERSQRLKALRAKALVLREQHPGEVALPELLTALRELATRLAEVHAPICRILGRLREPWCPPFRAGLVIQWSYLLTTAHAWWNPRRLIPLLRAFDEHLREGSITPERLAPWRDDTRAIAATGSGRNSIDQDLLEEDDLDVADIGRFFGILRWLEAHAPTIELDTVVDAVVRQLEAVHDVELAATLVVELHRERHHGTWIPIETLRAAWWLCEPNPAGYATVVRALERIENETELLPSALAKALGAALGDDRTLLRALLLDDDSGLLVRCGRKLAVLHALGRPVEPPAAAPQTTHDSTLVWIERYPAAFHDDLAWLCRQTPDAEPIAAKLLRSIHHGREATVTQQRAIEAMLPDAPPERRTILEARLRTLEQREAEPDLTPSPVKLERLRAKLRRRGGLARLEALEAEADLALPAAVGHELGLSMPLPAWALEERVLALLIPLRREPAPVRQLARALFRARAGPPPWDLRERTANAAFLTMLAERGIDARPWLEGLGPVAAGTGAAKVTLSLEDDPLEVFHMGQHFGTCLSPGQCNFFSVFANAADINKRVLYARDARGGVVGRRLFCLTQEGALLVFHSYCHDQGSGFDEASADFARRLAEAMGTVVVGRAVIPTLVAPRWYDDGPVDIVGQLGALADESRFRVGLREASPSSLPELVHRTFGQPKLDEATAPMVLALPELLARPELSPTMLVLVRHPDRLPIRACLGLVRMLAEAGAGTRARDVLAEPIVRALMQQQREHRWIDADAVEQLARVAPSRALDVLRRTRERGVRRWDDEGQTERLLAAGVAMEALHRRNQAIRMYRLAKAAYGSDTDKHRARQRLRMLEADPPEETASEPG